MQPLTDMCCFHLCTHNIRGAQGERWRTSLGAYYILLQIINWNVLDWKILILYWLCSSYNYVYAFMCSTCMYTCIVSRTKVTPKNGMNFTLSKGVTCKEWQSLPQMEQALWRQFHSNFGVKITPLFLLCSLFWGIWVLDYRLIKELGIEAFFTAISLFSNHSLKMTLKQLVVNLSIS